MNIIIRELGFEDTDFVLEIENDISVWKVSNTTQEFTKDEIEHFIAKNTVDGLNENQKRWVISLDDVPVGFIDLFDYDEKNKRAGIGIIVHKNYRNKGIAKIALEKFILFSKNKLKLHQLYCTIISENEASIKLFTHHGFIQTGVRKDWTLFEGKYFDEVFYQYIF
jgi:diamine N-acetyltransferase